jgi:FkbM family methyltransferase
MSLTNRLSQAMRSVTPALWQRLKYYQYLHGGLGEREIHIVHRFIDPTRAALDVGVHLGIYARHFARYTRRVIGFEANPDSAEFARRSLRGIAKIEWVALSSQIGTELLRIPIEGASGAEAALGTVSWTNTLRGTRWREISVPARTLDDFDLPPVGFIKIDVEGHEEAVLKGGEGLLERDRPVYMIEIEDRHNPNSLLRIARWFRTQNYAGVFYDGISFRNTCEFDHSRLQVPGDQLYINNFFFVPCERDKASK